MRKALASILTCTLWLILSAEAYAGLAPEEVLVVYNSYWRMYGTSERVANYYCAARYIPDSNKCPINCPLRPEDASVPPIDVPELPDFVNDVQQPIANYLQSHFGSDPNNPGTDPIKAIVLCYGVPYAISGSDRYSSVDSALTLLFSASPWGK